MMIIIIIATVNNKYYQYAMVLSMVRENKLVTGVVTSNGNNFSEQYAKLQTQFFKQNKILVEDIRQVCNKIDLLIMIYDFLNIEQNIKNNFEIVSFKLVDKV